MRGGMLLRMKRIMIKELKTILTDAGLKYTELVDYGIRIDFIQQVNGLDLPGVLIVYARGEKLVLHEKKMCKSAMEMYIELALQLKKRNAWVDGELFRGVKGGDTNA